MSETIFVTGATGLGRCQRLQAPDRAGRPGARPGPPERPTPSPWPPWASRSCTGDVTDADDVRRAANGSDAAIHCAALLGGASQNLPDFEAVNVEGTKHVLDAAEALGMRRVVAVSTGTFFDTSGGLEREDAPVTKEPSSGSLHHHQDGGVPRRHGPGGRRAGRGHHAPRRHLRPVAGGEQRARPDQLQPGAAVGAPRGASPGT